MSLLNSNEEKRLDEYLKTRAMCAGIILHALRDFTEGDKEAVDWLFDTDNDDLDVETELVTFPQACALIDLDPDTIRCKIKSLGKFEILELAAKLRRKKLPTFDSGQEDEDDFFTD